MHNVLSLFACMTIFGVQSDRFISANVPGTCGGTITGQNGGAIASPGFPDESYPRNANCTYIIEVEPGYVVAVRKKISIKYTCQNMDLQYVL